MTQTSLKNSPNSSLLKETRISKGLTLDIVHEATKIPMDVLKAIEDTQNNNNNTNDIEIDNTDEA